MCFSLCVYILVCIFFWWPSLTKSKVGIYNHVSMKTKDAKSKGILGFGACTSCRDSVLCLVAMQTYWFAQQNSGLKLLYAAEY